jgi:hypothetical protein
MRTAPEELEDLYWNTTVPLAGSPGICLRSLLASDIVVGLALKNR